MVVYLLVVVLMEIRGYGGVLVVVLMEIRGYGGVFIGGGSDGD
jgi:hypothetical protein